MFLEKQIGLKWATAIWGGLGVGLLVFAVGQPMNLFVIFLINLFFKLTGIYIHYYWSLIIGSIFGLLGCVITAASFVTDEKIDWS